MQRLTLPRRLAIASKTFASAAGSSDAPGSSKTRRSVVGLKKACAKASRWNCVHHEVMQVSRGSRRHGEAKLSVPAHQKGLEA